MGRGRADRRRAELPEILATVLEARGATVARDGMIWEAELTPELRGSLGVERVRLVASPAGRAARGGGVGAAKTERILLPGPGHGPGRRPGARVPGPPKAAPGARVW